MRFDWYQPTIADNPVVVVEALAGRLAPGGKINEGPGRHNYRQSFTVCDAQGDRVAVVLCGGANGDPNVTASGPACDAFVPVVRELWPKHRVTRADASVDLMGPGVYDRLEATCRGVAKGAGVKGRAIVPDDLADGRTYYMGAATSDVRVRLYDKTAERRRLLPQERWAEVPDNVARLECQVRPRKVWKDLAAQLSPREFWGFAGWSTDLAARALAMDVERLTMQAGRESDHERAVRYMLVQYGATLARMLDDHGDWAAVGCQIGYELGRLRESKRKARGSGPALS